MTELKKKSIQERVQKEIEQLTQKKRKELASREKAPRPNPGRR